MYCSECGKKVSKNAKFCNHCGQKVDDNKMQEVAQQETSQVATNFTTSEKNKKGVNQNKQKLEGFSGWLALFGLGILVTPISIFFSTIIESQSYDSWGIFLNILIIMGYIWLNYLMIKKKKIFKKWFIRIGISQIILVGLITLVINSESYFHSQAELYEINLEFFRLLFYVVIWSLYLCNSKRVKNTFIN